MIEWAVRWAIDNDWNVVAERFFPDYRAVACPPEELREVVGTVGGLRRISVGPHKPLLDAETAHKLVEASHDRLWMLFGALNDAGLREASISGGTEDPQTLNAWRRLLRSINAEMHAGARLRGPTGRARPRRTTAIRSAPIAWLYWACQCSPSPAAFDTSSTISPPCRSVACAGGEICRSAPSTIVPSRGDGVTLSHTRCRVSLSRPKLARRNSPPTPSAYAAVVGRAS
jgi:hypothetical protein